VFHGRNAFALQAIDHAQEQLNEFRIKLGSSLPTDYATAETFVMALR